MEGTDNKYQAVRIGDPSDWRLVGVISEHGMEAYLRNVEDPMAEVAVLFRESWESKGQELLDKVESAVYDHPQLLDDFSADIAVVTPRAIWVPESVAEGEDDPGERLYNRIFTAEEEDIMRDYVGDKVCLYSLTRGLQAFLQRTMPGARVRCHQSVLVERFTARGGDVPQVYIDIRPGEADFVAVRDKGLLLSVTHEWATSEDIRYHLFNILDVYGLDPKEVHVSVSGSRDDREALTTALRGDVAFVMRTMVPGIAAKAGMSLPAALMMRS